MEPHDRGQLVTLEIGELELAREEARFCVEDLEVAVEAASVAQQRQLRLPALNRRSSM